MVRLSSTLELLVGAGASTAEQFELLRWVRCLSPQGLADPAGVIALLDGVEREYETAERDPAKVTPGSPTLEQAQVRRLGEAGYLDPAGCEQFDSWPGEGETVARIVAEARAALGPTLGTSRPPTRGSPPAGRDLGPASADTIGCRTCGRQVPASARYCGYCGIRIS